MDEKLIVKSKQDNPLIPSACVFSVGFIASLVWWITIITHRIDRFNFYMNLSHMKSLHYGIFGYKDCPKCGNIGLFDYILNGYGSKSYSDIYSVIPICVFLIIAVLIYFGMKSYSLTITDKRIYGKTWFGKRVDLPVDSVSATSTISLFRGVSVSTPSGKISFLLIKNANEVYAELNNLVIKRQNEKGDVKSTEIIKETQPLSNADELKKYKNLLDQGIITQEEFEAKKKQLLGL